jgi:hypothetical protein
MIESFNHSLTAKYSRPDFKTKLKVGAGLGEYVLQ